MELKQLEYFRAIVDAGTISGAARDLHMTQPPLSYQIKMLEEELQVPLFLRGKKRITLTEAAEIQSVCQLLADPHAGREEGETQHDHEHSYDAAARIMRHSRFRKVDIDRCVVIFHRFLSPFCVFVKECTF